MLEGQDRMQQRNTGGKMYLTKCFFEKNDRANDEPAVVYNLFQDFKKKVYKIYYLFDLPVLC